MTIAERTMNTLQNELNKLLERKFKAEDRYNKKLETAKKYDVDMMSVDEHRAWMNTVPTENGFIINKEDIKKNTAYFDLNIAINNLNEIIDKIAFTAKKMREQGDKLKSERQKAEDIDIEKQRAAVVEEWAKDGITVTGQSNLQIMGTTPKGNDFYIEKNAGMTKRSWHCVTLIINGETIFTSGDISTAYHYIKNH